MKKILLFSLLLQFCVVTNSFAQSSIFQHQVTDSMENVYSTLYKALEDERYFVIFEPNMGKNLARMSGRFDQYNTNNLTAMRAMLLCNPFKTNQLSNLDPTMLALCPINVSLYEKESNTVILFAKPSVYAQGSPAQQMIVDLENEIIAIIKRAFP